MRQRANLDILRAFAVSSVLIDHLVPTMTRYLGFTQPDVLRYTEHIGYTGVIAFFVHTSFVLMESLERLHSTNEHVTWRFYVRRFFRLYPLTILSIVLMLVLKIPGNTWSDPQPVTGREIVSNLLLVQNLWVRKDVLGPLWSLPYEVQMYVIFPALYLLARKRLAPFFLLALYVLACVLGVALWVFTGHENAAEFIPCFLCGILAYSLRKRLHGVIPGVLWPVFVVAWIAMFCAVNLQYWTAWVFCLVLGLAINFFHDCRLRWLNVAAARVALYSFGIYLLHVPVLYLLFDWLALENKVVLTVGLFTITFTLSGLIFHLLEQPCIELGRRLSEGRGPEGPMDPTIASAVP